MNLGREGEGKKIRKEERKMRRKMEGREATHPAAVVQAHFY